VGKSVYGDANFKDLAPPLPPVRTFGGYQKCAGVDWQRKYAFAAACGCGSACGIHDHAHACAPAVTPTHDMAFWGALACSCWAV
jgi:hypothetical protein